jgi:AcrR family transcriptional regulator
VRGSVQPPFMVAHVNFRRQAELLDGLRSRKKARTRQSIEEIAFALFEEQGYEATTVEQISERAEISHTTFFRYFPSKADLVVSRENARLPILQQAIVERPTDENDLLAVRRAIEQVWLPTIDRDLTLSTSQAIHSSPTLRGLYEEITRGWINAIAEALAARRGLGPRDETCHVVARVAMGIFGATSERWIANRCRDDLGEALRRNFGLVRLAEDGARALSAE